MSRAPVVGRAWVESQGKDIKGSVLNVGGGRDEQNLRQLFPIAERYRILDIREDVHPDIVADVQNMPDVPSESEDCILAHRFLCEVPDVSAALKEFHRVLRPKGILLASFVGPGWLDPRFHKFADGEPKQLLETLFKIVSLQKFVEKGVLRVTYVRATKAE